MSEIQIYKLTDLENISEPEWLIDGILYKDTLAAIVGTRGTFKTFMALDWGLSIAQGKAWNGHATRMGNVVHIVGEGGRGIKRRAAAWRQYHEVDIKDTANWACTIKAVDLLVETDGLMKAISGTFSNLSLLIVDTLARNMTGDENNTAAMSSLVKQADALREKFGTTVLFLHHTNRQGTIRGNSSFDGALDTILVLQRKGETVTVYNDPEHGGKQKEAEEFEPFTLRRKRITLDGQTDGVSSIILELDAENDPYVEPILRILDSGGFRGVSREDALQRASELDICKASKFGDTWTSMKNREIIEVAEDSPSKGRGAKWIRSMNGLKDIIV